ncbi:glycoside hydrolase domain-containing protein [Niallia sp. 03133]|uniref:glycoside hydrolase domain-containing protein n=1 Tax=Niallia sp. 03133 TaxID=3458060 RepID=UPI004044376A
MAKGFDCATKLTAETAKGLKNAGFDYAARYLGDSWKSFNQEEAAAIQAEGLNLISIYQKSANYGSYFTSLQGAADVKEAMEYAQSVQQPKGTAIYFAVDFDASFYQLKSVLQYFSEIQRIVKNYKIGIYGSYKVVNAVKDAGLADFYWQTYAWSRGQVADFIHMYQCENNIRTAGVTIDRNNIIKSPGHWKKETAKEAVIESISKKTYHINKTVNAYINAADAKAKQNKKGNVSKGEYYLYKEFQGMINVTKKQEVPGSWINPSENIIEDEIQPKYHIVKKGETLTKIAKDYKTAVDSIKKLNPDIKNIDLIYEKQKIRIK